MLKKVVMAGLSTGFMLGCFGSEQAEEPVKPAQKTSPVSAGDAKTSQSQPLEIQPLPLPPDPCQIFEKIPSEPPAFIAEHGVMITRFMKPCVTRGGKRGYESDTPWIAMGFPCTAGGGKIDVTGYQSAPKLVSFPLSTDCPMSPSNAKGVEMAVKSVTDLPDEAKIMAYYPFVVQYWEIPDYEDADVGFSVDLVTSRAQAGLWQGLRLRDESIAVRLYGRENAWVQGDQLYEVEALLKKTGATSFELQVISAKGLTREEVATVKERCYGLSPRRNCAAAF